MKIAKRVDGISECGLCKKKYVTFTDAISCCGGHKEQLWGQPDGF